MADKVEWHRRHHFDLHAKNRGPIETEAVALLANNGNSINDYKVMVSGPPGEYYSNYKFMGDLVLNMNLMSPFHSASEKICIITSQALQPLASNCIQATPALRGPGH